MSLLYATFCVGYFMILDCPMILLLYLFYSLIKNDVTGVMMYQTLCCMRLYDVTDFMLYQTSFMMY